MNNVYYGNHNYTGPAEFTFVTGNQKIGLPSSVWNSIVLEFEAEQLICEGTTCYGYGSSCNNYTL